MDLQYLDWFVIISCLVAASGGYKLGLVTRLASWVGVVLGLVLAFKVLPSILRGAEAWQEANKLGLVLLLLLLTSLLGQMLGTMAGARLSSNVPHGNWRKADRVAGSAAGVFGVFVVMWAVLPVMADVPGWPAQQARSSSIAQAIDDIAPDPPDAVRSVNRLVGAEGFRPVFEGLQPAPDTGPAPESVTLPSTTIETVKRSTVRIEGVACRRTQNGSGFSVAPGLFATNAHVVAGQSTTVVIDATGEPHRATVVAFDSDRDIALLRTPGYSAPPLQIVDASEGDTGAVFGHPGGQPEVAVSPATVRDRVIGQGRDLYDERATERELLVLASRLAKGDSGGALVNTDGQVMGIVFAIAPDNPETAYALSSDELRAVMRNESSSGVDTGACLRD